MDPVKEETPQINADQTLIKETGGMPGADHPGQIVKAREEIAGNLGISPNEVIPDSEAAENGLEETEKAGFLEAVAGVESEENLKGDKTPEQASGLHELGENLRAFSPGGSDEENIRTASSGQFSDLVEKRKAA